MNFWTTQFQNCYMSHSQMKVLDLIYKINNITRQVICHVKDVITPLNCVSSVSLCSVRWLLRLISFIQIKTENSHQPTLNGYHSIFNQISDLTPIQAANTARNIIITTCRQHYLNYVKHERNTWTQDEEIRVKKLISISNFIFHIL